MVDHALRRRRCSDTLVDDRRHLEDPLALHERFDAIADLDMRRRFGSGAVYANMAASAGGGRRRTRLIEAHRPEPDVDASRLDRVIVSDDA